MKNAYTDSLCSASLIGAEFSSIVWQKDMILSNQFFTHSFGGFIGNINFVILYTKGAQSCSWRLSCKVQLQL